MIFKGYVKLHRSIWENDLFVNPKTGAVNTEYLAAWMWMISEANFKPNGIGRGELRCSVRLLATMFFNGSVQKTRTFLTRISTRNMVEINTQGSTRLSVISVCNYDKFQAGTEVVDTHSNTHHPETQHAKPHNHKEGLQKEGKEEEGSLRSPSCVSAKPKARAQYPEWFERFWSKYRPHFRDNSSKRDAFKAVERARKRGATGEQIHAAIVSRIGLKDREHLPMMATWINRAYWEQLDNSVVRSADQGEAAEYDGPPEASNA
jgi:hypothetical protein